MWTQTWLQQLILQCSLFEMSDYTFSARCNRFYLKALSTKDRLPLVTRILDLFWKSPFILECERYAHGSLLQKSSLRYLLGLNKGDRKKNGRAKAGWSPLPVRVAAAVCWGCHVGEKLLGASAGRAPVRSQSDLLLGWSSRNARDEGLVRVVNSVSQPF